MNKEIYSVVAASKDRQIDLFVGTSDIKTLTASYITQLHSSQLYICYCKQKQIGWFTFEDRGAYVALNHYHLEGSYLALEDVKQLFDYVKDLAQAQKFKYIEISVEKEYQALFESIGGVTVLERYNELSGQMVCVIHLTVIQQNWLNLHTAGLVVVDSGRLLLAYSNNKKAWYLPGGKIDTTENSREALIREIEEELGLIIAPDELTYLCPITAPAYGEKLNIMMRQDCYTYPLKGQVVQANNEIGAVKYFSYQEYLQEPILVPGVLMVYEQLTDRAML
ncbi:NUDIX domain-containing protein [Myroides pelagicus]|uniref:NUDIX hydrolase n=1 Tax=Myroides pelagicus TaxID=270914 RepID=UPI002DB72100|nr:NUDIX domain-containing protein [Myroides pelagicus]MEC4114795.1 NUDIX domain-containing protein [Myroides pelagicus]